MEGPPGLPPFDRRCMTFERAKLMLVVVDKPRNLLEYFAVGWRLVRAAIVRHGVVQWRPNGGIACWTKLVSMPLHSPSTHLYAILAVSCTKDAVPDALLLAEVAPMQVCNAENA